MLLFGDELYFVAFHSLWQSASREDSALALARETVIRPLTDRPELGKRGAVNFVVAPRPLENQRRKHQKTDRLDARALLDNLESYLRGKRDAMSKAWFPYFRLYAPTEDHFNRKWILPDFEKVQ